MALAEHEGHQLQTVGFFYKVTPKGEPVNHHLAQVMHMHADRLQLPIVEIPEPRCADSENKVHRTIRHGKEEESIIVSLDGYNFYLRGFDDTSGCLIKILFRPALHLLISLKKPLSLLLVWEN